LDSGPAPIVSPSQDEIDAVSRERALDALHRALTRLTGAAAEDWRHCGKAACLRSSRCRGFACEPETSGDDVEAWR
jgi:hypothetical protein